MIIYDNDKDTNHGTAENDHITNDDAFFSIDATTG